jgi:hypothetical protein
MMKTGVELSGSPSELPQYLCAPLPGSGSTISSANAGTTCPTLSRFITSRHR